MLRVSGIKSFPALFLFLKWLARWLSKGTAWEPGAWCIAGHIPDNDYDTGISSVILFSMNQFNDYPIVNLSETYRSLWEYTFDLLIPVYTGINRYIQSKMYIF